MFSCFWTVRTWEGYKLRIHLFAGQTSNMDDKSMEGSTHIWYVLPYLGRRGRGGASALLKRGRQHRVAEVYIGHLLQIPQVIYIVYNACTCFILSTEANKCWKREESRTADIWVAVRWTCPLLVTYYLRWECHVILVHVPSRGVREHLWISRLVLVSSI